MLGMQRRLGITKEYNVGKILFALQLKEPEKNATGRNEKRQHVVGTENSLFKGFTTKGIRSYNQKYSTKLDSDFRWR